MDRRLVAKSAFKHGVTIEDIRHAVDHAMWQFDEDDITMIIGGDRSGRLIEVGSSPPKKAAASWSTPCPPAAST